MSQPTTRFARATAAASAALLACGLLAACGSDGEATGEEASRSITIAEQGTAGLTAGGPAHVADKLGFFADEGLNVEKFVAVTKGSDALTGVAAGKIDLFHGADGMVLASKGGPVVGIASLVSRSGWTLVANPDVKDWSSLNDNILALSSTTDITRVVFGEVGGNVVDPKSVKYVALGAPSQRVTAVLNGQAAATFTTFPSAQTAVEKGLIDLGFTPESEVPPPFVMTEVVSSRAWLDKNPDVAESYLRALKRALDYMKDPANLDEVAAILAESNGEPVAANKEGLRVYYTEPTADGYFTDDFRHIAGSFEATVEAYTDLGLMTDQISEDDYMEYKFADAVVD